MTVISYAARSSARPDVEKSKDGMKSCSPSCVVHERYSPSSSSAESRCCVKLDRKELVSSESDLVLARPMIEAEPLTVLLDMCKPLSPSVQIRVCAHDVDKRSFILLLLLMVVGVECLCVVTEKFAGL